MSDRIEKTIVLKAPVEKVWHALTDHEAFGAWFRVKLDRPFEPGAASTGQMLVRGFEHVRWNAVVKDMKKPHLFSFTWHPYAIEPDVDYSDEIPTLVEFRLEPVSAGTRLTVTESGFEMLPAHRFPDALRMNTRGWEAQLENVRAYVDTEK